MWVYSLLGHSNYGEWSFLHMCKNIAGTEHFSTIQTIIRLVLRTFASPQLGKFHYYPLRGIFCLCPDRARGYKNKESYVAVHTIFKQHAARVRLPTCSVTLGIGPVIHWRRWSTVVFPRQVQHGTASGTIPPNTILTAATFAILLN